MMMHEASYVDPWQFPDHFIGLDIEAEHAFRKKPPTPLKPSTPQQKQTEQAISAAEQAQAGAAADTLQNSLTAISGQPIPQSSLSNQFAKSSAASTTISSKATASALAEALYNQRRNQAFASRQQQTDNQRSHREQMALTMKLTREARFNRTILLVIMNTTSAQFFERMSKFIQKKTAKQEELKKAMVEHEREKTEKHLASMFASNVEGESSSGAPKNENDSVAPPQEQLST
jgi:hypothetical protein